MADFDFPPGIDLFQIAYEPSPPGVTSDFEKRSSLLTLFLVLISVFIFITTAFILLRIRARVGNNRRKSAEMGKWKLDDCEHQTTS